MHSIAALKWLAHACLQLICLQVSAFYSHSIVTALGGLAKARQLRAQRAKHFAHGRYIKNELAAKSFKIAVKSHCCHCLCLQMLWV